MEREDFLVNKNDNYDIKKMIAESEKRADAFQQENTNLLFSKI